MTASAHEKRCRRCTAVIDPSDATSRRLLGTTSMQAMAATDIAAMLAGFCSRMCSDNDALDQVSMRSAWWLPPCCRTCGGSGLLSTRGTEGEQRQGVDAGRSGDEDRLSAASTVGANAHTPPPPAAQRPSPFEEAPSARWNRVRGVLHGAILDGAVEVVGRMRGRCMLPPSSRTVADVIDEVVRSRQKFPGSRLLNTALGEEVGELCKAFLQRKVGRGKGTIYAEAMQVACVAMRIMEEGDPAFADVTDEEAKP